MKIAVLIPYYKCSNNIKNVVSKIKFLKENDLILICDDGSNDNIEKIDFCNPRVKIFKNPENIGYGGTSQRLYILAQQFAVDFSISIHGDGGHDPDDASSVLQKCIDGYDICIGSRLSKIIYNLKSKSILSVFNSQTRLGMPVSRLFGHLLLTWLQNFCYQCNHYSYHEGLRACNKKAINWIVSQRLPKWYDYDEQLLIDLNNKKFKICEIPVNPNYNIKSKTSAPSLKYGLAVAYKAIKYKFFKK